MNLARHKNASPQSSVACETAGLTGVGIRAEVIRLGKARREKREAQAARFNLI